MNISQLLSSASGGLLSGQASGQLSTKATAQSGDAVSAAVKKAGKQVQTNLDTTTAQLSAFGKLKSSVSDAQQAAQQLTKLTATSSTTDVKNAATRFVAAFNTALGTARTTAGNADSATGGSRELMAANRVTRDLARVVNANPELQGLLKKLGVTPQADGSLKLDADAFAKAQASSPSGTLATLTQLGRLTDAAATRELASGGVVDASISSLTQRATSLKAQQTALQNLSSASTSSASSTTNRYGLSAYLKASA